MGSEGLVLRTSSLAGNVTFSFYPFLSYFIQSSWLEYFQIFWVLLSQKTPRKSLWEVINGSKIIFQERNLISNKWTYFPLPAREVPWSYNLREIYTSPKLQWAEWSFEPTYPFYRWEMRPEERKPPLGEWARSMFFKKDLFRGMYVCYNPSGCWKGTKTFIYVIFEIIINS